MKENSRNSSGLGPGHCTKVADLLPNSRLVYANLVGSDSTLLCTKARIHRLKHFHSDLMSSFHRLKNNPRT